MTFWLSISYFINCIFIKKRKLSVSSCASSPTSSLADKVQCLNSLSVFACGNNTLQEDLSMSSPSQEYATKKVIMYSNCKLSWCLFLFSLQSFLNVQYRWVFTLVIATQLIVILCLQNIYWQCRIFQILSQFQFLERLLKQTWKIIFWQIQTEYTWCKR